MHTVSQIDNTDQIYEKNRQAFQLKQIFFQFLHQPVRIKVANTILIQMTLEAFGIIGGIKENKYSM